MSPKPKCHQNINVTKTDMSPKLKCHHQRKKLGGFLGFILVYFGLLLEMAGYGGKVDYPDQPR